MVALYETMPFRMTDGYRAAFQALVKGNVPLIFHCTAGKDRTGVLAALILAQLGASRSAIEAEYLLTRKAVAELRHIAAVNGPRGTRFNGPVWDPVFNVDAFYLEAMFAALEARCGTVADYLRGELGLSEVELTTFRNLLVE